MLPRFPKLITYLSLLLLGGVLLSPLVTYATLTLDSTSITTDDTLKLKGGNVGVGNITPTSNLHVSGTLTVTATTTLSGASTLTGAVTLSNPSSNSLIYTNSSGVITALASSTAGKILTASGTAPYFSWETTGSLANLTLTGPSTNSVIYTGSAGLITALASSTAGKVLMATSTAPYFSWETDATGGTVSTLVADGNNEITVGSTTSALTVNIANAALSAAQTINIGSGSTGATSTSINIGNGTAANTITLGAGTGGHTINIGTGTTTAKTINIGTANQVQNTITIGNASSSIALSGTLRITEGNQGAGKSLYSDASGGATWQTPSSTLKTLTKITTAVSVVNTTTETNLLNYTIPAGTIGTDKQIRAVLVGHILNNSGAARWERLRVKLGGTTIIDPGASVSGYLYADADRLPYTIEVFISATGAANSQFVTARWMMNGTPITPTAGYGSGGGTWTGEIYSGAGRTSIDMASAQALVVSIEHATAHASLEMKMEYAIVEVIE